MTRRRLARRLTAALVCGYIGIGASTAAVADEPVDFALVLASDVSASVNEDEFRLQRDGYAAALQSPLVLEAIGAGPRRAIAVSFLEWSSSNQQKVVVGWTVLRSDGEGAMIVANALRAAPRSFSGSTAIGSAIEFSVRQFVHYRAEAERRAIDVSGDGTTTKAARLRKHATMPSVRASRSTAWPSSTKGPTSTRTRPAVFLHTIGSRSSADREPSSSWSKTSIPSPTPLSKSCSARSPAADPRMRSARRKQVRPVVQMR